MDKFVSGPKWTNWSVDQNGPIGQWAKMDQLASGPKWTNWSVDQNGPIDQWTKMDQFRTFVNKLVSGLVTLPYRALIESGLQSVLNQCTVWYGSLQIVTIPDTVDIQFSFLLRKSTSMLETC